jgi:hypothetical protein
VFHTASIQTPYIHTYKRNTSFSFNQLIIKQESILHIKMRLSLIFFGLSTVFMVVSSLSLGSVGLEKRQVGGVFRGVGGAVGGVGDAVGAVSR